MKKSIYLILIMLVLGGCGGSSEGGSADPNRVKIDSLKISLIGDAKAKYQRQNREVKDSDTLDAVGNSPSDLSNENSPIPLNSGYFYNIDFNFKTTKAFSKGVNFAFIIVDGKYVENFTADKYHKLLYYTNSGNISEAGDHSIKSDVFIATDIPAGKYALVAIAIDEDTKKISNQEVNLKKSPMLGAVYIEIVKDNTAKRVELVDINGSKYIDLPYTGEVVDGHTNKKVGDVSLVIYNTSNKDEDIVVSAQLELDNGNVINLALLDTMDGNGTVKDKVKYTLPVSENYMAEVREMRFSYYIFEDDYVSLVNSLPDLSIDENSDGLKGKVIWKIQSGNSEIITNDGKNSVLLTKFLYNYTNSNLASVIKPNKELVLRARIKPLNSDNKFPITAKTPSYNIMDYVDDRPIISIDKLNEANNATKIDDIVKIDAAYQYGGGNLISGKNIVGYIDGKLKAPVKETKEFFNYSFDKIDAAFKMDDSIYFFRGDKYVIYDAVTKETSEPTSIWELYFLQGIDEADRSFFDRIDATVYYNDLIYFFSGNRYCSMNNMAPGEFYFYEIKNMSESEYASWRGVKHITAAFSAPSGVIFFNNLEVKVGITKENIFKYSGKLDEFAGWKKYGAIGIKGNYNIKGKWKVPGLTGSADARVVGYLNNDEYNILSVEANAEASLDKKHPSLSDMSASLSARTGGRILITLLKDEMYSINEFTDISIGAGIDDVLDPDEVDVINQAINRADQTVDAIKSRHHLFTETYTWKKRITILDIRFTAGPVPIRISGGFDGDLGVGANLSLEGVSLKPAVIADADLYVWVEAGVDAYVVAAKVAGDIHLISSHPTISLSGELYLDGGNLSFKSDTHAEFILKLIKANLYAKFVIDCWLCSYTKKFTIYNTSWLFQRNFTLMYNQIESIRLPL